jgi:hypothetical protein
VCPSAYGGDGPLTTLLTVSFLFTNFVIHRPHLQYKTFHIPIGPRSLRVGRPRITSKPSTLRLPHWATFASFDIRSLYPTRLKLTD